VIHEAAICHYGRWGHGGHFLLVIVNGATAMAVGTWGTAQDVSASLPTTKWVWSAQPQNR
jgi:hypothetical protein